MKRHESLYPLSHDHHHALVQARNLIVAAATSDRDEIEKTAAQFTDFWASDLQSHFLQEEQIILPLLAKRAGDDNAETRMTLEQHAAIRLLIGELNGKLARREAVEANLLKTLGESLRHHIRFEENELFPALESSVPEDELWRMNRRLNEWRESESGG
ncbi:MAG: hypothetical protein JMDDDDMK_01864 [Acidobacteria bacterium]|nr:hypothetical protein [Acidobacteriota bacterium]